MILWQAQILVQLAWNQYVYKGCCLTMILSWVSWGDFYIFWFDDMIVLVIPRWIENCGIILRYIIFNLVKIAICMMIKTFWNVELIIMWMLPEFFISNSKAILWVRSLFSCWYLSKTHYWLNKELTEPETSTWSRWL